MKLKKITALIFTLAIIFICEASIYVSANAHNADNSPSLKFSLTSEAGSQVIFAEKNDIITVRFVIDRTDSDEAYTISGFQNYIHYDLSFFEFVDGSIVCLDTGSAVAKKQNSITYGETVQCQNMGNTYTGSFVFCTFQLKVIAGSGSSTVNNGQTQAFDNSLRPLSVTEQNLRVVIDNNCSHTDKILVESKDSTCNENGWHAYRVCDDCGTLFEEEEETMISDVPYTEKAHTTTEDTLTYDAQGHWYICNKCGEAFNFSNHYGGKANCTSKANCECCGQEWGNINSNNHVGGTVIKNAKEAQQYTAGYTGDIHCASCDKLLTAGKTILPTAQFLITGAWIAVFVIPIAVLAFYLTKHD